MGGNILVFLKAFNRKKSDSFPFENVENFKEFSLFITIISLKSDLNKNIWSDDISDMIKYDHIFEY